MKQTTQTFNDGLCSVYSVVNDGQRGGKAKPRLTVKHRRLRYAERVVGLNRFWTAGQQNVAIDKLIRVARLENVSTQDIAVLEDGQQYAIRQVQYVTEGQGQTTGQTGRGIGERLTCMDLSLERMAEQYDIAGVS